MAKKKFDQKLEEKIKAEEQRINRKKRKKRQDADMPHFSVASAIYVWRIYRQAVGKKRYFTIFYGAYQAIISSVTAILLSNTINEIKTAITTHNFFPFVLMLSIILLIQLSLTLLAEIDTLIMEQNYQDVYCYAAENIAKKYISIPLATREDSAFADKFNRVRDFAGSISTVSNQFINIFTALLAFISAIVATTTISPIITLIVVISAIPYSVMSLKLASRQRINYRRFSRDRRIAWMIENKIINSESALEIELNDLSDTLISRMVKARRRSQEQDLKDRREFFWPNIGSRSLEDVISFVALIIVSVQITLGQVEIGNFMGTRMIMQNVQNSIVSFFGSIATAGSGLANSTDYMEFMEAAERQDGDIVVGHIPSIEFKNVSFTYPKSHEPAIKNISFKLDPGESIAVVGENGAGKTTLIKLLIGAYQPDSGLILIDGHPIERIKRESYLSQVGALFQNYSRFEFATLGENVWFGDVGQSYNRKKIMEALRLAGLEDLPKKYKSGLNQVMGRDMDPVKSTDVSGGQWQRICIARAFFRAPNLLILDEPTSAVDAKAEAEIFKNILQNQVDKSTIIISHRFSTVRKAKKIIVLDKGKIIEQGSHEELVAENGLYKEMFDLQAEGYR